MHHIAVAETCSGCGQCVLDCPAGVLAVTDGRAGVVAGREKRCIGCQHCFAVCSTGALAFDDIDPADSRPLKDFIAPLDDLETLVRARRSVRRFRDEDVEPGLLDRLLETAWAAPTGVNGRQVRFTLVNGRDRMARLREDVVDGIDRLVAAGALPASAAHLAGVVRAWRERKQDVIFRGAPHLLVASAPRTTATPVPDCLIALTTFELLAQAAGLGTCWVGYARTALVVALPERLAELGIPDDHEIVTMMLVGRPAVRYARTAVRGRPLLHRVN